MSKNLSLEEAKRLIQKAEDFVLVKGVTRAEFTYALSILDEKYGIYDFLSGNSLKLRNIDLEDKSFSIKRKLLDEVIEIQYEMRKCRHYKRLKGNVLKKLSKECLREQMTQCFVAYENGLYYSCVCGLLPFLERMMVEENTNPKYNWENLEEDFRKKYREYFNSDIENNLAEYNIRLLVRNLSRYIEFNLDEPDCLNRNWLLHGRANRLPTKVDCLKIFNIIEVIVDIRVKQSSIIK